MNFYELNKKMNEAKLPVPMTLDKQMNVKLPFSKRKKLTPSQLVQQFKDREFYAKAVERAQAADKDTDTDEAEHKIKMIKSGEQFASRKKGKHRGRPKGATVGGNPRYSGKKGLGSTDQPDNFRTKDQSLT